MALFGRKKYEEEEESDWLELTFEDDDPGNEEPEEEDLEEEDDFEDENDTGNGDYAGEEDFDGEEFDFDEQGNLVERVIADSRNAADIEKVLFEEDGADWSGEDDADWTEEESADWEGEDEIDWEDEDGDDWIDEDGADQEDEDGDWIDEDETDWEDDAEEEPFVIREDAAREKFVGEEEAIEEESVIEDNGAEEDAAEEDGFTNGEFFTLDDIGGLDEPDEEAEEYFNDDPQENEEPEEYFDNDLQENEEAEEYFDDDDSYENDDSDLPGEQFFGGDVHILDMNQMEEDEDEKGFFAALFGEGQGKLVLGAALLILAFFMVAAVAIVTGRGSSSVEAFSSVSSTLEDVSVIGEEALSALMESKNSTYQATLLGTTQTGTSGSEYEETDESDTIYVALVMTSVEKDLKIKFTNASTGKLIANVPFSVKVTDSKQKEYTWTDEDKDGIIYMSGLVSGTYKVTMLELEGELYERYSFGTASETVTVRDTIVYEVVDVSAEIKDETEINVAEEEAQVVLEVESVKANTVEWVESTKTLNSESYTEISKSQIQVPTATSVARSFLATAITNSTSSLTLTVGETGSVSADSDLDGETLTYSSSDDSVASVSGDGTVTANGEGSVVITITEKDSEGTETGKTDTCTVTVNAAAQEPEVTSKDYSDITLSVSAASSALSVGGTTTVTPSVSGKSDGETWSYSYASDNTSVATVDGNGKVTAVAAGTAKITVTAVCDEYEGTAPTATCTITVSKSYSDFTVSLDNSTLSLAVKGTGTLSASVSGATSGESLTYEYTSSSTSVATASGSGSTATVTGVAAGTATITVKAYYTNNTSKYATATCTVTVSKTYSALTLSIDNSTLSLTAGKTGTIAVTVSGATSGETLKYEYSSSNTSVAKVSGSSSSATITAVAAGTATITAKVYYENKTSVYSTVTCTVTVRASSTTALKTTDGQAVYVLENGSYRVATYNDYYTDGMKYYVKTESYTYTGWQTISGSTYYYDANGNRVTGTQVIQGIEYTFDSEGALQGSAGTFGIDVSSHNGSIDWPAVANSGVSFAIIRCGYRGYGSGVLVEDSRFRANIQGAINAGIKVGVYFFSQAVTTTEAVEEASMVLQLVSGYSLSYPIYIDVEYSNSAKDGRADSLSVSDRTAIVKAFCQTVVNSGYSAGIYANKTWLTSFLDMSQLSAYKVWLAQYASAPTYSGTFHMWQYSSSGSISGISGSVDLNMWYY
ncbi:MAG: Ig-like domain-containing protein [Lachnospiraceae bacterium]|nr:Ig-like domain-containing protein [Lachnospiraceae bacterium]